MDEGTLVKAGKKAFGLHGWVGIALAVVFWPANWLLPGLRTTWAFFPLWLGYCLVIDALVLWRTGTSLLTRSRRAYVGLFLVSAPCWWLFEALNLRVQNWEYLGTESFNALEYFLLASINFSVVMPAVFGAAEWFASLGWIRRIKNGPRLPATRATAWGFFLAGWVMLVLMLLWPQSFFPFTWLAVLFILEPVNFWLGFRSLSEYTGQRDWRPLLSLWAGVLLTGFFWEMWNYFAFPKWVYHVPGVEFAKVFEMPILGYTGYLPFALELFALYHLIVGLLGGDLNRYIRLSSEDGQENGIFTAGSRTD